MKHAKIILYSFIITLFLWGIISWPLPLYTLTGIPASHHTSEVNKARVMIPGDHLQFLYHLWLAHDTFKGNTPWFYNLHEFNLGDDEARKSTSMRYYLPFSLFYSAGAIGGNHAFGWNFMGFISLWLTWIFTWLLARRYTENSFWAMICACISIIFPYRWFTLLGGSPTGLAMALVPIFYYGLDIMVGDKKMRGAVLAGAVLCLSEWSDPHVTFFTGLTSPFWCVLSFLFHHKERWLPDLKEIKQFIVAASPLVLFGGIMIWQAMLVQAGLDATVIAKKARPIIDVAINSPHLNDAFSFKFSGVGSQIYVGYFTVALLALSLTALAVLFYKQYKKGGTNLARPLIVGVLLALAVGAVVILATGVNMPGGVRSWQILTRVISPYGKIRQPAKIFCIMPLILSIAFAVILPRLLQLLPGKHTGQFIGVGLLAILMVDYGQFISPSICILDKEQAAYQAIATDSHERDIPAHLLALPLWPGNSHWSSINQHYVSLYNLRMVNGYRPTPKTQYMEYIDQFSCFNKGYFPNEQIDELLSRGISYLIIHEDAFPEKVSQFAVAHTINAMLTHPRIEFLAKDRATWTFRMLETPSGGACQPMPGSNYNFPSRLWQAERCTLINSSIQSSSDTSANKYVTLSNNTATAVAPSYSFPWSSNICYKLRLKSKGGCIAKIFCENKLISETSIASSSKQWHWHDLIIPKFDGHKSLYFEISPASDKKVDFDLAILATSSWDASEFKQPRIIPAPAFFHAGYTDLETGEVVLEPDRVPADAVFYGPKLPIPAGVYKIKFQYSTEATDGTILGELQSRYPYGEAEPMKVVAGKPAILTYKQDVNLRLAINFIYSRNAQMRIKQITIIPEGIE